MEAQKVGAVWSKNTQFTLRAVTLKQFKAAMEARQIGDEEVEARRRELTALINQWNAANRTLKKMTTQAHGGIRGFFGPDSDEYEQAGACGAHQRAQEAQVQTSGWAGPAVPGVWPEPVGAGTDVPATPRSLVGLTLQI